MALNYTNNSIPRPSQIYPNFDFWYENIPSGNPDLCMTEIQLRKTLFSSSPLSRGRKLPTSSIEGQCGTPSLLTLKRLSVTFVAAFVTSVTAFVGQHLLAPQIVSQSYDFRIYNYNASAEVG
jgi:hypothetical protein